MTVRLARPDDFEGIMTLCKLLHEENGQHTYNDARVRDMIDSLLNQRKGAVGVIGDKSALEACICLVFDQVWYSDEWQLLELFAVVRPDCRSAKLGYAGALIDFAKWLSDQLKLDLMIGVLSDIRMEAKVRLYSRKLPKAGEFFCYRPEGKP